MLKVKPFRETPGYCGPASLKMVLEYYGVRKSEKELARLSGASRKNGVEAPGLLKAAHKLGFQGSFKDHATFSDIWRYLKQGIPVIVDWFSLTDGHYSVVVGIDKRYIYLQDPELGRINKLDLVTFKRVWFDFPGDFLHSPRDIYIRRLLIIKEK